MNRKSKYLIVISVFVGIVIGALVFSQFNNCSEAGLLRNPAALFGTTEIIPAKDRPISSLRDINNAFVEISKSVTPTVVTVFTEKTYKIVQRNPLQDFWNDFFYGGPGRQQQPKEKEYQQKGLGSGVIVSPDGFIITNNHVVEKADSIYVSTVDEKIYPARIIGADPKTDVAIIKIEANGLNAIKLGDSDKLQVGEWVLAIGSPLGANLAHTVTQGIVSAKGRSEIGLNTYEDFIQTDAAINPGNSGGALINLDGELVGINSAIISQSGGFQGIGFAIPVNMARNVMESLLKFGKVIRGWLGVSIQNIDENMAKALKLDGTKGTIVSGVADDSPAAKAGLQPGDAIIELNGSKVKNASQLSNDIAGLGPNSKVTLGVVRDGKKIEIKVVLAEFPSEVAAIPDAPAVNKQLGFSVSQVTQELAKKYALSPKIFGVVVTAIDKNSPAFGAGLREGDVIQSINRKKVGSINDFNTVLQGVKKGDYILLNIVRQNSSLFLAFSL